MTHKDDQDAAIKALKRKQGRTRPAFLNQDTLDRVAHGHAKELIELGGTIGQSHKTSEIPKRIDGTGGFPSATRGDSRTPDYGQDRRADLG